MWRVVNTHTPLADECCCCAVDRKPGKQCRSGRSEPDWFIEEYRHDPLTRARFPGGKRAAHVRRPPLGIFTERWRDYHAAAHNIRRLIEEWDRFLWGKSSRQSSRKACVIIPDEIVKKSGGMHQKVTVFSWKQEERKRILPGCA